MQPLELPASIAGLLACIAMVCVGPSLYYNGPNNGSMLFKSPGRLKSQLPSLLKLWPVDVRSGWVVLKETSTRVGGHTQPTHESAAVVEIIRLSERHDEAPNVDHYAVIPEERVCLWNACDGIRSRVCVRETAI